MISKCKICGKRSVEEVIEDFDTREVGLDGKKIIVKKVRSYKCSSCGEDWIESKEIFRIRSKIQIKKNLEKQLAELKNKIDVYESSLSEFSNETRTLRRPCSEESDSEWVTVTEPTERAFWAKDILGIIKFRLNY